MKSRWWLKALGIVGRSGCTDGTVGQVAPQIQFTLTLSNGVKVVDRTFVKAAGWMHDHIGASLKTVLYGLVMLTS